MFLLYLIFLDHHFARLLRLLLQDHPLESVVQFFEVVSEEKPNNSFVALLTQINA